MGEGSVTRTHGAFERQSQRSFKGLEAQIDPEKNQDERSQPYKHVKEKVDAKNYRAQAPPKRKIKVKKRGTTTRGILF